MISDAPRFDYSPFDSAPATASMNSPAWVYERGCRKITFPPEDTNFLKAGTQPSMPVPWDDAYLTAWEQFLQALGRHIHDWPDLYCVQMTGGGFIGEMHLPKKSASVIAQWEAAGINDDKLISMLSPGELNPNSEVEM